MWYSYMQVKQGSNADLTQNNIENKCVVLGKLGSKEEKIAQKQRITDLNCTRKREENNTKILGGD